MGKKWLQYIYRGMKLLMPGALCSVLKSPISFRNIKMLKNPYFLEFCSMSRLHGIVLEPRFSKLVLLFEIWGFKRHTTELQSETKSMGHSVDCI